MDQVSDTPGLEIIPMGSSAFKVIAALHARIFTPTWSETSVQETFVIPGTKALVATYGEGGCLPRPVGFLMSRHVLEESEILSLGVLAPCRGQGIARKLMQFQLNLFRQAKIASVFLEVSAENSAAIALYSSLGFAHSGVRRNYYTRKDGSKTDALIMRLSLS